MVTNKDYIILDGVKYSADKRVLIEYPTDKKDKTFFVPDFVLEIADKAFYGNRFLKNLHTGKNLRKIGYAAFSYDYDGGDEYIEKIYVSPSVTELAHVVFPCNTCDDFLDYASVVVGGSIGSAVEKHANEREIAFVEVNPEDTEGFFSKSADEHCDRLKTIIDAEKEYTVVVPERRFMAKLVGDTLEIANIGSGKAVIGDLYARLSRGRREKIKKIVFGDGIGYVEEYEFFGSRYPNLASIHIGANMYFYDVLQFYDMNITEITCSEKNPFNIAVDNLLYTCSTENRVIPFPMTEE